jgi:hypothetical protein
MGEYEEWESARTRVDEVMEASQEEGGPRVSLVPGPATVPDDYPTDMIRVTEAEDGSETASIVTPFPLESSKRCFMGWSAERQRMFIEALAETGSVHGAAATARLSARGAYKLRTRSPAFAAAWDAALQMAVGRLSAIAFDRAISGRVEQIYEDGTLVAEKKLPNDRLLMWLLSRLDPKRFAGGHDRLARDDADPQAEVRGAFPALLDALANEES